MVSSYYNYSTLFSYNGTYNFVVGGRGLGKTYGAKKKALKDAIKSINFNDDSLLCENQFIYLRRYKPELKLARDTFVADISHEFKMHDFRVNGIELQASLAKWRNEKKRKWVTIGYFIALVSAQSYKSVAFPKVKLIIFDEFIIEKGHIQYLPEEAKVFNNFYSTVDRYKDKTKVLFLANSVSITNPYFIEFKISPNQADDKGIIKLFKGFIVCHFPDSSQFESEVYQTAFGKFIQGTEYAEYAVDNKFADNNDRLIKTKDGSFRYQFTLETKIGTFSVWYNVRSNKFHLQEKLPKEQDVFTLVHTNMDENKTLVSFSDKPMSMLRTAYSHANMTFDQPSTRNAFVEVFKR